MSTSSPDETTLPGPPAFGPPGSGDWGAAEALLLLALIGATFLLFGPGLRAEFVAEDFESLGYRWSDLVAEASASSGLPGLRPGTVLFFATLEPIFGRHAEAFRSVVLCLHAGCAFALYRLARRTLRSRSAALLAGTIFLGAPVHPESVVWLASAAGTVTSSALVLAACLVWTRRSGLPTATDQWLTGGCFLLALEFKETALPLPLLLFCLDLALDRTPGRFPAPGPPRTPKDKAIAVVARYRGPLAALSTYSVALLVTGAWRSLVDYAARETLGLRELLVIWSAYAHDLLRPLAPDKRWAISPPFHQPGAIELWALAAALAATILLGRRRWTALWTIAALLPGIASYGERLTYLAVAGSGLVAAGLLLQFRDALDQRGLAVRPALWRGIALGLCLVTFSADRAALSRELAHWVEAGKFAARIPIDAKALLPDPPHGAKLYFRGLIDNFEGAYSLRMGVQPEMQRVYGDATLQSFIVADRRPRGRRVLISQIACDDPDPRFFFSYDSAKDQLQLLDPLSFGLPCTTGVAATLRPSASTQDSGPAPPPEKP